MCSLANEPDNGMAEWLYEQVDGEWVLPCSSELALGGRKP
jgi:hypothetical protein